MRRTLVAVAAVSLALTACGERGVPFDTAQQASEGGVSVSEERQESPIPSGPGPNGYWIENISCYDFLLAGEIGQNGTGETDFDQDAIVQDWMSYWGRQNWGQSRDPNQTFPVYWLRDFCWDDRDNGYVAPNLSQVEPPADFTVENEPMETAAP